MFSTSNICLFCFSAPSVEQLFPKTVDLELDDKTLDWLVATHDWDRVH